MSCWTKVKSSEDSDLNWCWLPGWSFRGEIYERYWQELPGNHWLADYRTTVMSFEQMAKLLSSQAPDNATWIGWSLGGALAIEALKTSNAKEVITLGTAKRFTHPGVEDPSQEQIGMPIQDFHGFKGLLNMTPNKALRRFISFCYLHTSSPETLKHLLEKDQYPFSVDLVHTLSWLEFCDLSEIASDKHLHLYSEIDFLNPEKIAPSLIFKPKGHAFFLGSNQLLELLLDKVMNGSTQ